MKESIVIGDIHINSKYDYKKFFEDLIDFLEEKKYEYKNVIFLGDFIDSINKVRFEDLYKLKEIVDVFLEKGKNIYILVGNHDVLDVKKINVFDIVLSYNERIKIIKEVEVIDDILFLPYTNKEEIKEVLENIDLEKVKYIYSHNDFNDLYHSVTNKTVDISISEVLKKYNNIKFISGHIHNWFVKDNIYVVGCSFNTSFSDKNIDNLILHIDEKEEITGIKYRSIVYFTFEIRKEEDIYKSLFILSLIVGKKEVKFKIDSKKYESLKYEIDNIFDKDLFEMMNILNVYFVKSNFEENSVLNILPDDIKNKVLDFTTTIYKDNLEEDFIESLFKYIVSNFNVNIDNIKVKEYIEKFKEMEEANEISEI